MRPPPTLLVPAVLVLGAAACNPAPPPPTATVGFRDGAELSEPNSGERGSIKITEVLWSGTIDADGRWDPTDVFVELRNEGVRPINLSGWRLVQEGTRHESYVFPTSAFELPVDGHALIVAKDTGCFPNPDLVLPGLAFSFGDPFVLILEDADERLIEPIGSSTARPFAGGYDGKTSRSMERIQLMFGSEGTQPHLWHYYTPAEVDVPNDDRMAQGCRARTLASPGRPNSPDYSGAFASGSLE